MPVNLRDLTKTVLDDLNEALTEASSRAADSSDDSGLWSVVYDLEDAVDLVENALKRLPTED